MTSISQKLKVNSTNLEFWNKVMWTKTDNMFNRLAYEKNFIDLKNILDQHGIKFFLAFGTLLGAIRDGGFIEGDTDTDLFILESEEEYITEALSSKEFNASGFEIVRVMNDLVSVGRNKCYIDISVFRKVHGNKNLVLLGQHFIEEYRVLIPEKIKFLGHECLIPKDPESYLTDKYGDWKNKSNKHATT